MYRHGFGVKTDHVEALKWYRKAAIQNYVPALNDVGYAYDNGLDVERDDVAGLGWYLKAMKHGGNFWTPLAIGKLYQYGQGVEKNAVTTLACYNITTIPDAKLEKAKLMKKMTPDQIAGAQTLSKQLIKIYPMDSKK
jgi:TPR repeat protein